MRGTFSSANIGVYGALAGYDAEYEIRVNLL
jgi:hypothetical protein